ncbi:NUDIX hydrolase domain-like protein [Daedaleopsis nitida]|nr:NUDIX hydrolase domain-like protein [Daedaleopsis nitida]
MTALAIQLPPGTTHNGPLIETASGGSSDWLKYMDVKRYTDAFVIMNDSRVLLGFKKRGFGKGLWHGFGGKIEEGETPLQAAGRELKEEAGIGASLVHCGVLLFATDGSETANHIDVFRADEYSGRITETDEMRPEWFTVHKEMRHITDHIPIQNTPDTAALPDVPFGEMWEDGRLWLPLLFAKRHFVGRADFDSADEMVRWWFAASPQS